MPDAVLNTPKRVLGDATRSRSNMQIVSPTTAKKRKLEDGQSIAPVRPLAQNKFRKPPTPASSQHKSQFVEEVLEKMTQDMNGLKESNSEKDQQWERPPLDDFDPVKNSLCFQQIECEEGTLGGGKTTVKLFGVTEVCEIQLRLAVRC